VLRGASCVTLIVPQYHKLNNELAVRECTEDVAREYDVVDEIVISSVAMKSVMT
jgi:EKC/KEOPS complex subunit CGI121/TPRKB